MLLVLTAGVHKTLQRRPNADVRDLLGSSTRTILGGLAERWDRRSPDGLGPLSLACGAVPSLRLDAATRKSAGHVLASARQAAQQRAPSALFAVCFCGGRLLAAARPKHSKQDARRLRATDALLLLNFVQSQKAALIAADHSWTPVCLPRFDDRGFLHARGARARDGFPPRGTSVARGAPPRW